MQNHLKNETSPYLLQHSENPVNWYPWCDEAFERAKREEKPIFLSIGYSTCHWCHVMAHECFEDEEVAEVLNRNFISIKVDKEERPDIDAVYMSVCQALTGSGGWPTSIFLTSEQKPFFAGTYFPKYAKYGQIGFLELLSMIDEKWKSERRELVESAEKIVKILTNSETGNGKRFVSHSGEQIASVDFLKRAVECYRDNFDSEYGGFGEAPKFPAPHNLLFLMQQYEKNKEEEALRMAEKTLLSMYRGGMFDHIGGGFCRYSTDRYFFMPHFEKMLYDNALLMMAYCKAYQITKKWIYCHIAERTAEYILREMTSKEGGFYSAQDADSEGKEGRYYLLKTKELLEVLGQEAGEEFNRYFNMKKQGNLFLSKEGSHSMEEDVEEEHQTEGEREIGENIPNLLQKEEIHKNMTKEELESCIEKVYEYRKKRAALHVDDKILTSWNGLMIAAMCQLYRISGNEKYLSSAKNAQQFIENYLQKNDTLYVSYREGKCSREGFLDDYANEIFALLSLYEATLELSYLEKAKILFAKVFEEFWDEKNGGFFLYGKNAEELILRSKETYDGAVFSGNSAMVYNLVRFALITEEEMYEKYAKQQLAFMYETAKNYPCGYAMFLTALSDYLDMPEKITIILKEKEDLKDLSCKINLDTMIRILEKPTKEYPMKDEKTTYYVCKGRSCRPSKNEL